MRSPFRSAVSRHSSSGRRSRRSAKRLFLAACFVVGGAFVFGIAGTGAVAGEVDSQRFLAELETGEFAPAFRYAQAAGDGRDAALERLAAAQAGAGAKQAAATALGEMADDRARLAAVDRLFNYDVPFDPGFQRGGGAATAGAGGGVQPDFESLIELITSTIRQSDWVDNGGTVGHIKQHAGGIYVDADGQMKPIVQATELARLASLRREAAREATPGGARRTSSLRKISLTRLEREVQALRALGRPIDEEMQTLAGLQRITHLFVYPESGEVVLAGPAGDWYRGRENRLVSTETDRPVLLLDDLITLLRREFTVDVPFGCSIEPTTDGLNRVRSFVEASTKRPLEPSGLNKWTTQLRDQLGRQNVEVFGIDPRSRVAETLAEADYRMKLLGIEREPSILSVPSYFQIVRDSKGKEPPSMGLLRWWFTANYEALLTSADHDVYELRGQGVQLLSENEFLSQRGERISTGTSDEMNSQFAANFTQHFVALAQKHPLYADLQNIFDLALVCSVLKQDRVCDRCRWNRLGFSDPRTPVAVGVAPTSVESVANGTMYAKNRVMAVLSGGVRVDLASLAKPTAMEVDARGRLTKERQSAAAPKLEPHGWWWD